MLLFFTPSERSTAVITEQLLHLTIPSRFLQLLTTVAYLNACFIACSTAVCSTAQQYAAQQYEAQHSSMQHSTAV